MKVWGRRRLATAVLSSGIVAGLVPLGAQAAPAARVVSLPDSVLPASVAGRSLAAVPGATMVQVSLSVQRPDAAGEAALYRSIYDPASAQFHHFISPADFAARFGVPAARTSAIASWIAGGGVDVSYRSAMGTVWLLSGTAARIDALFHTTLRTYRAGNRTFFANDRAPQVPADLGIEQVALTNYFRLQTHSFPVSAGTTAQDLWSIYGQPSSNTGQGQQMALFGWGVDTGVKDDLRAFEAKYDLPEVPFRIERVGAAPDPTDTGGKLEWDLDSQASTGMAPGVTLETFYFSTGGTIGDGIAGLQTWADDSNGALQGSASWSACEDNPAYTRLGAGFAAQMNATLEQAASEGRTLFASTGDTGSGCGIPVVGALVNGVAISPLPLQGMPAASPFAVAVGGTTITTDDQQPPHRDVEYAWTHGGGGRSVFQEAPAYQGGVAAIVDGVPSPCLTNRNTSLSATGQHCRGIPDVAAQGGDFLSGYSIVADGADTAALGTSLSSPLWLGMWTRVQAAAPAVGSTFPGNGFANEVLYPVGKNPTTYARDFYDVTIGVNGLEHAAPGWDYTTGWGVPNVTALATDVDGTVAPANPNAAVPAPPGLNPAAQCWTDPAGDDAVLTEPETGQVGQYDLLRGALSDDGTNLTTTLTIKNLLRTAPVGVTFADYFMFWKWTDGAGTEHQYFTVAHVNPADGSVQFFDGEAAPADPVGLFITFNNNHQLSGPGQQFNEGPNGTIVITTPLANIGSPPAGAKFTAVTGQALYANDPADLLSNSADTGGPYKPYIVGSGCVNPDGITTDLGSGGGGGGGGPAECGAAPQITDPEGDSQLIVLAGSTFNDTDITSASYTQPGSGALTVSVTVKKLRADTGVPPLGSTGETFDIGFTIGTTSYYVRASRTLGQAPAFTLRKVGGATAGTGDTTIATITGSFNPSTNTVTATVPAGTTADLAASAVLTGLTVSGFQNESAPVTGGFLLRDDSAGAACKITLT